MRGQAAVKPKSVVVTCEMGETVVGLRVLSLRAVERSGYHALQEVRYGARYRLESQL
jgi:hypothetical protein